MIFEEIKIGRILLEELKKLSGKGKVFDKESIPKIGGKDCKFKILPPASMILKQLQPYAEPITIDTISMTPDELNQLIYNLEEFLSIFDRKLKSPFITDDIFEFHRITDDVSRLTVKRNMSPINFDGMISFDFHGGNKTIQDLIWFFQKVFGLKFDNLQQGAITQYQVK